MDPQVWWMWHQLAQAEERFNELLRRFPSAVRTPLQERLLRQALRELLLMQGSDWSFLVVTGSAREYAEQRFVFHAHDYERLCALVERAAGTDTLSPEELAFLEAVEQRDALFPELAVEWWEQTG
jgi:1,4-alpha-glucan branching enzyme